MSAAVTSCGFPPPSISLSSSPPVIWAMSAKTPSGRGVKSASHAPDRIRATSRWLSQKNRSSDVFPTPASPRMSTRRPWAWAATAARCSSSVESWPARSRRSLALLEAAMGSDTVADISPTTSNRAPDHICIQPGAQFSPGSQDAESGAAGCSLSSPQAARYVLQRVHLEDPRVELVLVATVRTDHPGWKGTDVSRRLTRPREFVAEWLTRFPGIVPARFLQGWRRHSHVFH